MKKYFIFLVLMFLGFSIFALEMEVVEFEYLPNELQNQVGKIIYDEDGNPCSVLKIETDLESDLLLSKPIVHKKTDNGGGIYYFYIRFRERFIVFGAKGYTPYTWKTPRMLTEGKTYLLKLMSKKSIIGNIPVTIQSEPLDAIKIINEENLGNGETFKLKEGIYKLKLAKEGYKTLETEIEVNENNTLFKDYKLQQVDLKSVQITSMPLGAEVFINGQHKGKTPLGLWLYPEEYELKLSRNSYLDIMENINVEENKENILHYNMQENVAYLKLLINPAEAKVFINKEDKGIVRNFKLAPATYKINVQCPDYYPYEEIISLKLADQVSKEINLKGKAGTLLFSVQPLDAKISLQKNNKMIETWQGMKQIKDLLQGEYTIISKAKGYKTCTEYMTIVENKTTELKVNLEKGADISPKYKNSIGMEFVLVEAGSFMMGKERGKIGHKISITKDYYIGKYEVTQKQWKAVMSGNLTNLSEEEYLPGTNIVPVRRNSVVVNNPSYFKGDNKPVENVSWNEAQEFIKKLNEMEKTDKYRLPTEAEWEFAARGGNQSQGYTYAGSNNINEVAFYQLNSAKKTYIVGSKKPNELGIYDMSGNVWEWCSDWYDNYSARSQIDPMGAINGTKKVLRGGSWGYRASDCRVFVRSYDNQNFGDSDSGFRLVLALE